MYDHRHVEPVAVDEAFMFRTQWYCEPPPAGEWYTPLDYEELDHKTGLMWVRKIYAWTYERPKLTQPGEFYMRLQRYTRQRVSSFVPGQPRVPFRRASGL